MLQFTLSTLGILITIFFVIGTHETAHFLAARWLGVKVLRFSIGFGKAIYRRYDRSGTEYVIAMIPLGGYVKMLDEREESVPENELSRAFNRQPLYKKLLIVVAGPLMNLLCAAVLYWVIYNIGFTAIKPIIGTVAPHSIAAKAGLKDNQEILALGDERTATWTKVVFRLLAHAGDAHPLSISVQGLTTKQGEKHELDLMNWQVQGLMPDPLGSLGITPYQPKVPLIIGYIVKDSPAAASNLQLGDKLLKINQHAVMNWDEAITMIAGVPNTEAVFTVLRHNKKIDVPVLVSAKTRGFFERVGYVGIAPDYKLPEFMLNKIQYGPLTAIKPAIEEVENLSYFNLLLFKKLLTGTLSLETLGGPITIFESAGASITFGLVAFLGFLAFLSVSIGIINLFPIPGLDGGHVFIMLIETIKRKPLSEKVLVNFYRVGFLILFFILTQALINDILRLYS